MMDDELHSFVLGVTGGLACGKSEVGRILGEMGFAVCDADCVAHDLMKKGTPVYRQVVDHFGTCILSDDGEIARSILGKTIFENPAEREALNRLVHPAVRENLETWIAEKRQQGQSAAMLVPLLFESGMDALDWDEVICVSSSEELVFQRLEKRGLGRSEAELRMRSQMPLEEKERRSDRVVPNLGTLAELEDFTRDTVKRAMAER
jgi:dephospho-CoA kinase